MRGRHCGDAEKFTEQRVKSSDNLPSTHLQNPSSHSIVVSMKKPSNLQVFKYA